MEKNRESSKVQSVYVRMMKYLSEEMRFRLIWTALLVM